MTPLAIQSCLGDTIKHWYVRKLVLLTFSEVPYPLSIDGITMLVHIRDKEVTKMSDNRPTDTLRDNPLDDGFGFDITKLFHR